MAFPEQVKQSTDLAVFGTAATINVAQLNEWITLVAGVLAILWSAIRIGEWAAKRDWRKRRAE